MGTPKCPFHVECQFHNSPMKTHMPSAVHPAAGLALHIHGRIPIPRESP
jgi:hypothetical protein